MVSELKIKQNICREGWRTLLGDYVAGVDYPVSHFYKEILKEFPDVKVGLKSFFLIRNQNWNMKI